MFNLEQAITKWRRQMTAEGLKNSAVLDELESHLREDIERQLHHGANAQQAFEVAVKNIGAASALRMEFRKSGAWAATVEKVMIAVAGLFVAFGIFLTSVTLILCYGTLGERLAGFSALGAILAVVLGWPRVVRFVPAIPYKRKRWLIEAGCLLLGFGFTTFYVQVILPHFDRSLDRIIPAIGFWGVFPLAIGFGLACAVERAAGKATEQITA